MSKILKNNNAPLFEYLEAKQNEEFSINFIKDCSINIRNNYIVNFCVAMAIIFSICLTFYVQFKVDMMQNKVNMAELQIEDYNQDLKLLNVEWIYLTRPERIRKLSNKYLNKNQIIAYYQVKSYEEMQKFYMANLKKYENVNVISNLVN